MYSKTLLVYSFSENGLCGVYARYYDPQIGVFISADSVVPDPFDSQALHRYMYVRGNPMKYTDPSGHKWYHDVLSGIATVGLNAVGLAMFITSGGQEGMFGYVKIHDDWSFEVHGVAFHEGKAGELHAFYNNSTGDFYFGFAVHVQTDKTTFSSGTGRSDHASSSSGFNSIDQQDELSAVLVIYGGPGRKAPDHEISGAARRWYTFFGGNEEDVESNLLFAQTGKQLHKGASKNSPKNSVDMV